MVACPVPWISGIGQTSVPSVARKCRFGILEITEGGIDEVLGRKRRGGCGREETKKCAGGVVEGESGRFFAHYIP